MKKIICIVAFVLIVSGCGGSNSSNSSADEFFKLIESISKDIDSKLELIEEQRTMISIVNSINIVDGATDEEQEIFSARKNEAISLIKEGANTTEIEEAITNINNTNTDISNRIVADVQQTQQNNQTQQTQVQQDNNTETTTHDSVLDVESSSDGATSTPGNTVHGEAPKDD